MTSVSMTAPLDLAAKIIPESLHGSRLGDLVDVGGSPKFLVGQRAVQLAGLVQRPVQAAVDDHAPVATAVDVGQAVDAGGAVGAQGMIPARPFEQAVEGGDVI